MATFWPAFETLRLCDLPRLQLLLSERRHTLVQVKTEQREADEMVPGAMARAINVLVLSPPHNGDEKSLGANAEARQRAITVYLDDSLEYQEILGASHAARRAVEEVEAQMMDCEAALKLHGYERSEKERVSRDSASDTLRQAFDKGLTVYGIDSTQAIEAAASKIATEIENLVKATYDASGRY